MSESPGQGFDSTGLPIPDLDPSRALARVETRPSSARGLREKDRVEPGAVAYCGKKKNLRLASFLAAVMEES